MTLSQIELQVQNSDEEEEPDVCEHNEYFEVEYDEDDEIQRAFDQMKQTGKAHPDDV